MTKSKRANAATYTLAINTPKLARFINSVRVVPETLTRSFGLIDNNEEMSDQKK
jgi:hypothetical protein